MAIKSKLFGFIIILCIKRNEAASFHCPHTDFDFLSGSGKYDRNELTQSMLSDDRLSDVFEEPVSMEAFQIPSNATHPTNTFCGTLDLIDPQNQGNFRIRLDMELPSQEAHHLPPFSQSFVQHGSHLIPLHRSRQDVSSIYWELIVSPGRVWDEVSDIDLNENNVQSPKLWSRASFPFALIFKQSNPHAYNGVMTFTFSDDDGGKVSNVAYEIVQETSLTFRYDYWGLVQASYTKNSFPTVINVTEVQKEYEDELKGRIPTKDYMLLEDEYGIDTSEFEKQRRISFFAFDVGGVAYTGGFDTRYGRFPYPESLIVTSHSFAKTFFSALIALAMEEEFGNVLSTKITDLIDSADRSWDDVSIENVLDMSTGHYRSPIYMVDDSIFSCGFFQSSDHQELLDIALNCYGKKRAPGASVVYHSSDTYIAVVALRKYLEKFSDGVDIVDYYNTRISRPLGLSKLIDNAMVTTNDPYKQPLGYAGFFFSLDDILKLSRFTNPGNKGHGKVNGARVLDLEYLDSALQREERGLPIQADGYTWYYKLGFWSLDLDNSEDCPNMKQIPIAKGFGGQMLAMFPNNTTYVSFSSSLINDRDHRVQSVAQETMEIQCV